MSGIKMSIFSSCGARSSVRRSSFGKGPRFVLCFGNGARVSVLGLEHAAFKLEDCFTRFSCFDIRAEITMWHSKKKKETDKGSLE